MYFSEDSNTEGLIYARPVIGLIKYNRTLGFWSVFLRIVGGLKYVRLVIGLFWFYGRLNSWRFLLKLGVRSF